MFSSRRNNTLNLNYPGFSEMNIKKQSYKQKIMEKLDPVYDYIKKTSLYKKVYPDTDEIPRKINFNTSQPCPVSSKLHQITNARSNNKYSKYTFIFKYLFEQFSSFSNFYFLIIALSQYFKKLRVGFLISYIAPVVIVLIMSVITETLDELKRRKKDKEINSYPIEALEGNTWTIKKMEQVRVGDVIKIKKNEKYEMDLLLLQTSNKEGETYIRTDELDGETDWKLRRSLDITQSIKANDMITYLRENNIDITYEKPKNNIYVFNGELKHGGNQTINLILENTMWASTCLVTDWGIGLVIYTGKDTRMTRNTIDSKTKYGKTEKEINTLMKVMFLSLVFCSISLLNPRASKYYETHNIVYCFVMCVFSAQFFRYLILFSHVIPMSMRLSVDVAKLLWAWLIKQDPELNEVIVRNTTIPEELGRISFLLTDKTGTLTQNVMKLRKMLINPSLFLTDKQMVHMKSSVSSILNKPTELNSKNHDLYMLIRSMVLCHNITVGFNKETKEKKYYTSSPDELAIIKMCEKMGVELNNRNSREISYSVNSKEHKYEIIKSFPFSSTTKRMGIVLKSNLGCEFFVKGAEIAMEKIVNSNPWFIEEVENLARDGLRTMVFGYKKLTEQEALLLKKNPDFNTKGFDVVAISGIEDKLQEGVPNCLEILKSSGIKIWMLTGDKVETALCIARSARLIGYNQPIIKMIYNSKDDDEKIINNLNNIPSNNNQALIIDGASLKVCLEKSPYALIRKTTQMETVLCCRCSPEQKAAVVRLINETTGKNTAAIGDGGNDISMIREASVGFGIMGKEGKQAAAIADYALPRFSSLQKLVLWHGRNSYKNVSNVALQVVSRGLLLSLIQYLYSWIYYRVPITMFGDMKLLLYTSFHTGLMIATIYIDRDIRYRILILYPELYREMLKGRLLNLKNIVLVIEKALYQGATIILVSVVLFNQIDTKLSTIAFASLLMTCYANIMFSLHKWNVYTYGALVASSCVYVITIFMFRNDFDFSFHFSWENLWKSAIVVCASVIPVILMQKISEKIYPPSSSKFNII